MSPCGWRYYLRSCYYLLRVMDDLRMMDSCMMNDGHMHMMERRRCQVDPLGPPPVWRGSARAGFPLSQSSDGMSVSSAAPLCCRFPLIASALAEALLVGVITSDSMDDDIHAGSHADLPRPRDFAATVQSRRGSVPVGFEDASSQSVQGFDMAQRAWPQRRSTGVWPRLRAWSSSAAPSA